MGNPRQVNYDYWVVKLNSTGSIQWQKCLGGKLDDLSFSIQQTGDGGYVVAGFSLSTDEDVAGHHKGNKGQVNADYWIVKLNPAGAIQWQKCLGGKLDDKAHSVRQTADGGYVVAGYSLSNDGDVSGNHGRQDYWIVQLDAGSNIQWQKSLGGSLDDFCYSVLQKNDDGYVAVGSTNSNNGDVSGNHGNVDYWVISLDGAGSNSSVQRKSMTVKEADPISFTFYPNPARENITIRSSGATIPGDLMLLLFNAAGQKIKEISIQSSNTSVSLSGLAGGLYIYQVTNRRQILQTGRIIVEKGSKTPSFNQTNIKTSY